MSSHRRKMDVPHLYIWTEESRVYDVFLCDAHALVLYLYPDDDKVDLGGVAHLQVDLGQLGHLLVLFLDRRVVRHQSLWGRRALRRPDELGRDPDLAAFAGELDRVGADVLDALPQPELVAHDDPAVAVRGVGPGDGLLGAGGCRAEGGAGDGVDPRVEVDLELDVLVRVEHAEHRLERPVERKGEVDRLELAGVHPVEVEHVVEHAVDRLERGEQGVELDALVVVAVDKHAAGLHVLDREEGRVERDADCVEVRTRSLPGRDGHPLSWNR